MKKLTLFAVFSLLLSGVVVSAEVTTGGSAASTDYASPGGTVVAPTLIYPPPTPTEILGQSQTIQWFPYLTLNNWQARIETGSGYMDWRDPNFTIWSNPVTPGADGLVRTYSQIERVILTIGKSPVDIGVTGTYESIVDETIATIRTKYPNLKEIILQPLAAGPNRTLCTIGGETVKTTANLPAIEDAIAKLVAKHTDVKKGLVPLVSSCSEFADSTGHLTTDGRINIAKQHDKFYAPSSTPTPTPRPVPDDSGFVQFNDLIVESVSSGDVPGEIVATVYMPIPMMGSGSVVMPMSASGGVSAASVSSVSSVNVSKNCYKFADENAQRGISIACPTPPTVFASSAQVTPENVPSTDVKATPMAHPYRMSYHIKVGAKTQLLLRDRSRATLRDFSAGDRINVFGYYNDDGSIGAYVVRNLSKPVERQTIQLNGVTLVGMSGNTVPATLAVTQTEYNPCYRFDVRSAKMPIVCPMGAAAFSESSAIKVNELVAPNWRMMRKYAVLVGPHTIILDRNRRILTLSDLKEGDELNIYGETTDNAQTVVADIIRDMSLPVTPTTLSGTITNINVDGSFAIQTTDGRTVTVQNPAKVGIRVSVQGMFDRRQNTFSQVTVIHYGNPDVISPPVPVPLPTQPVTQ